MEPMKIVSHTIYSIDELFAMAIMQSKYSPVTYFDEKPVHEISSPKELPGEVFRTGIAYVGKNDLKLEFKIEGSNYGRIRLNKNILAQYNSKPDYAYLLFNIKINKKTISVPVHRVIATLWCFTPLKEEISELEVHHISNNGYDNRPSNLVFVKSSEHAKIHKFKLPC